MAGGTQVRACHRPKNTVSGRRREIKLTRNHSIESRLLTRTTLLQGNRAAYAL
jgi:hypothetical protein